MLIAATNKSLKEHYQTICNSRLRTFSEGETIPQTSDNLWLIKRGMVKTLTWNESGKIMILGYWGQDNVIGLPLSAVEAYEVQCLNFVEAACIPWEQGHYLFKEISYCVQQTEELLRVIRIEKMYNRLAQLLIWLAQRFGSKLLQGVLINLRLTHQELADIMGSTRVTVTRLLNQLEQEEIIIRPRRFSIIVKDLNLLKQNYY